MCYRSLLCVYRDPLCPGNENPDSNFPLFFISRRSEWDGKNEVHFAFHISPDPPVVVGAWVTAQSSERDNRPIRSRGVDSSSSGAFSRMGGALTATATAQPSFLFRWRHKERRLVTAHCRARERQRRWRYRGLGLDLEMVSAQFSSRRAAAQPALTCAAWEDGRSLATRSNTDEPVPACFCFLLRGGR